MTNTKARDHGPCPQEAALAALRGDCARMVPHWAVPHPAAESPVSPALIHGVVVPPGSARLLDAMDE